MILIILCLQMRMKSLLLLFILHMVANFSRQNRNIPHKVQFVKYFDVYWPWHKGYILKRFDTKYFCTYGDFIETVSLGDLQDK